MQQFKLVGLPAQSAEGMQESDWILLDFGDIIVHLFHDYSREIYDLDQLLQAYPQEDIPAEYYYGPSKEESIEVEESKKYF